MRTGQSRWDDGQSRWGGGQSWQGEGQSWRGGPVAPAGYAASKVPLITAYFWIIKLLSTAMGEATSDYMVRTINPVIAVLLGFTGFVIAMVLQFRARAYNAWIYWLAVVMVAVFGTQAADVLHIKFGVPYIASTAFYAVVLAVIFTLWYRTEGTLSIHSIRTPRRELFYWATVLATFALGTATGDLTARTLSLGYLTSGIWFSIAFAAVAVAHWKFHLNPILAFWVAYVLTRPVGASFADYVAFPHAVGGLGVGHGTVALVLTVMIVILVAYMAATRKDVEDPRQAAPAAVPSWGRGGNQRLPGYPRASQPQPPRAAHPDPPMRDRGQYAGEPYHGQYPGEPYRGRYPGEQYRGQYADGHRGPYQDERYRTERYQEQRYPGQSYPAEPYQGQRYAARRYPEEQDRTQQYRGGRYPEEQDGTQRYPDGRNPEDQDRTQRYAGERYPEEQDRTRRYADGRYPEDQNGTQGYPDGRYPEDQGRAQRYPGRRYGGERHPGRPYPQQPRPGEPLSREPRSAQERQPPGPARRAPESWAGETEAEQTAWGFFAWDDD